MGDVCMHVLRSPQRVTNTPVLCFTSTSPDQSSNTLLVHLLKKNTEHLFLEPPSPYLVILGQDAVHVCNVLAGDLLDDQRAVVGVEEQTLSLVIYAPHRGAAGQRNLDNRKQKSKSFGDRDHY